MENKPLVSIIIPTDNYDRAVHVIPWLIQKTAYANYEIIVVCNADTKTRLYEKLKFDKNITFIEYNNPYNYSAKCNMGAKTAQGSILVFCQDKLDFHQENWLDDLTELLVANDEIGGISPKIIRTDNTLYYAGAITWEDHVISTPYTNNHKDSLDLYWSRYNWTREVSVLSATCLAVKRNVFIQIGGFDALHTPDKYSNADLSFKIRELGLTCVYNNRSEITNHFGGHWDGWQDHPSSVATAYIKNKWHKYLHKDPYFTNSMKRAILGDYHG